MISHVLSPRVIDLDRAPRPRAAEAPVDVLSLPSVAIVDTGIPADHVILSPYRRGQYMDPDSFGMPAGDHGSFVGSRAVFGDVSTMPHALPSRDSLFTTSLFRLMISVPNSGLHLLQNYLMSAKRRSALSLQCKIFPLPVHYND